MNAEGALNDDFRDILHCLIASGARFLVVGAHAMGAHGVPRATGDLDLFIDPGDDNAARVLDALTRFGAPVENHGLNVRDLTTPGTLYQIGLPPRRIDLLTSIDGISFPDAWAGHIVVQVEHLDVPFIGLQALIENKRASGREKDLLDVRLLEAR